MRYPVVLYSASMDGGPQIFRRTGVKFKGESSGPQAPPKIRTEFPETWLWEEIPDTEYGRYELNSLHSARVELVSLILSQYIGSHRLIGKFIWRD